MEPIEIVDRDVNVAEIRRIINMMHNKQLCTPEAQVSGVSMWANATELLCSKQCGGDCAAAG